MRAAWRRRSPTVPVAYGSDVWVQREPRLHTINMVPFRWISSLLPGNFNAGQGHRIQPCASLSSVFKDALFIGFSPSVAVGVWVGQDSNVAMGRGETGAKAALPIWIEFMKQALSDMPIQYFDIPDDVIRIYMDPSTGMPLPDHLPQAVAALFKKGTEP